MVFDAFVALEKSVEMVALWPDVFLEEGERAWKDESRLR